MAPAPIFSRIVYGPKVPPIMTPAHAAWLGLSGPPCRLSCRRVAARVWYVPIGSQWPACPSSLAAAGQHARDVIGITAVPGPQPQLVQPSLDDTLQPEFPALAHNSDQPILSELLLPISGTSLDYSVTVQNEKSAGLKRDRFLLEACSGENA